MKILTISLILISTLTSCSLIFEEDISESEVVLFSPATNMQSPLFTHTFSWETLNGAVEYHLQVATPSFNNISSIVEDTIVSNTYFSKTFDLTGQYEWRVSAINNGYETEYSYRSFTIDASVDLTGQIINMLDPLSFFYTNKDSISFYWESLPVADYYHFSVQNSDSTGSYMFINDSVFGSSLELNFNNLTDGRYFWKLLAYNSLPSISMPSSNSLFLDRTSPNTPELSRKDTVTANSLLLEWSIQNNSGSPEKDSLIVLKNGIVSLAKVIDSTASYNLKDLQDNSVYVWKIKRFDAAGNESGYSVDTFATDF